MGKLIEAGFIHFPLTRFTSNTTTEGDTPVAATKDDALAFMEVFNKCGELCQSYGMKYGYHNHDFEFMKLDGEIPYDLLLSECDATVRYLPGGRGHDPGPHGNPRGMAPPGSLRGQIPALDRQLLSYWVLEEVSGG